jgi:hypothetical protein
MSDLPVSFLKSTIFGDNMGLGEPDVDDDADPYRAPREDYRRMLQNGRNRWNHRRRIIRANQLPIQPGSRTLYSPG